MPNESPQSGWTYQPNDDTSLAEPDLSAQQNPQNDSGVREGTKKKEISWTASEFIENHKDTRWHMVFYLALAALAALVFIFTRDYFSTGIILVVGTLFAILANRKPRQISYQIDYQNISIGRQVHAFSEFKSFSVAQADAISYVNLMPLKRFMPEVSIYYPPEEEQEILDILSDHLPHDQQPERVIDRLAKKIHF